MLVTVPFIVTVQLGRPVTPPAATLIVNGNVEPLRVPEKEPLKAMAPLGVAACIVPFTVTPVWVSFHVMVPGPLESEAAPDQTPFRFGNGHEAWPVCAIAIVTRLLNWPLAETCMPAAQSGWMVGGRAKLICQRPG